jgi:O-antigen/teichoic acid export membrane protein
MRGLRPYLKREQQISKIGNQDYWRQSLGYGWKASLSNIISFINYRVDVYVVNLYLNPAALGVYALAVRIAEQLGQLSGAVSAVLLPRVSELHADENRQRAITPIAARWTLYLTGAMALGVLVIGRLVINILGADYSDSFSALVVLLPGIVSLALSRVLANDIAARGRPDLNIYTSLITIMVEVPSIFFLIQPFGVVGAAMASTMAYSAQAITSLVFYARLSKNDWWLSVVPNRSDAEMLMAGLALLRKRVQARRSN